MTQDLMEQVTVDVDMEVQALEEETNKDYEMEKAVVRWTPESAITSVHGLNIPANLSTDDKMRVLKLISKYIGGETVRIDKYLNRVVWVKAVMQHDVQVKSDRPIVNATTGEVSDYKDTVRTVLHIVAVDNKMLHEPVKVSFTSIAVRRFIEQFVTPLFGIGELEVPIPLIFHKVPAGQSGGSTYAIESPEDVTFPGGEK